MLCKRGLSRHAVSTRLSACVSVMFVCMHSVKTNKHTFKFFSPSGSHTILIFPYQTSHQYFEENPRTQRGRRMHVGRQKLGFWSNIGLWLNRILWTLRRPAAINRIVGRYPAIDRCLLLSTDGGPSSGVSQTVTVQVCLWHRKPRTTEYAEEKRTYSLIYAAVNLTPEYRPNRRLRLMFCRIEANYWQTRNIARPLCNNRASCLE